MTQYYLRRTNEDGSVQFFDGRYMHRDWANEPRIFRNKTGLFVAMGSILHTLYRHNVMRETQPERPVRQKDEDDLHWSHRIDEYRQRYWDQNRRVASGYKQYVRKHPIESLFPPNWEIVEVNLT